MGIFHSEPFFLLTSVHAAASYIVSPPFFYVTDLSRSPPGESGIGDVNPNDRSLNRCRKTGRRDRTIGNCTVAVTGDERRGVDRCVSDYPEAGNISVTYGLDDGKIRSHAGRGYSSEVVRFSRDTDSVPASPGVVKIESMMWGRSGETEPLRSLVAGQHDYGAGNQWHVETEERNMGEDGKESVESLRRTNSNIANWSKDHSASDGNGSNSNSQSVVSRAQDDQCEGMPLRLQCSLRVVSDS
jgi:hypothetical protein